MGIWDVPLPVSATFSKDLRTAPWRASALRCLRTLICSSSPWAALCCRCNCLLFTETQHTQLVRAWPAKSEFERKNVLGSSRQPGDSEVAFTKTPIKPLGPEPLSRGCGNCCPGQPNPSLISSMLTVKYRLKAFLSSVSPTINQPLHRPSGEIVH